MGGWEGERESLTIYVPLLWLMGITHVLIIDVVTGCLWRSQP